jgi:hypothetical protein
MQKSLTCSMKLERFLDLWGMLSVMGSTCSWGKFPVGLRNIQVDLGISCILLMRVGVLWSFPRLLR